MRDDILRRRCVQIVGSGEPTIVFAHGFGSDQTSWRHQVAALAPRHRVVLFDHLGSGRSDTTDYDPREYDRYQRYSEDVLAIYEALGLTGTIFVGHSASAMIGVLASLARPEAFAALVLVGASPRYLDDEGYRGGFRQADLDALYEAMSGDYFGWASGFAHAAMRNTERPSLGEEFARQLSSMRPDICQSVARVIFESDLRSILPAVRCPCLILQSRNDIAVPIEVGELLAARIPGSRLIMLDAEGHLPHLSAPDQVTAAIREIAG